MILLQKKVVFRKNNQKNIKKKKIKKNRESNNFKSIYGVNF